MATRFVLLVAIVALSTALAGIPRSGAADTGFRDFGALEQIPVPARGELRLELSVEPGPAEPGSGATGPSPHVGPVRPDPEAWSDGDPWADALAETRLAAPGPRAHLTPYPFVMNEQVRYFIDRFTGERREVIGTWLSRAGQYLGMIRDVLRRNGLPEDLAFTAMIESGFNPVAVSRAGAKGLWQFMAATARRYGLRVDQWVDERLDPEKATGAAAAYFRDLHGIFGSWTLAQAAYNAGEMKVIRALRSTGAKDFWPLTSTAHLRRETKDFVPQIQAAALIGRDPRRYGFEVSEAEAPPLVRVSVPPTTDLRSLATAAGLSAESLRTLNPVLLKGVTPPGAPYEVRVPLENRDAVLMALAPAPRATMIAQGGGGATRAAGSAKIHVVRPRDTINSIAKRYGMSAGDVLRLNSLERHDSIRPGDRLRVASPR